MAVVFGELDIEFGGFFPGAFFQGLEIKRFEFGAQFGVFGWDVVEPFGEAFYI